MTQKILVFAVPSGGGPELVTQSQVISVFLVTPPLSVRNGIWVSHGGFPRVGLGIGQGAKMSEKLFWHSTSRIGAEIISQNLKLFTIFTLASSDFATPAPNIGHQGLVA